MKDKQLHTFRRQPDLEFTHKLYQKLAHLPPAEIPQSTTYTSRQIRPAWVFAALLLTLSIMAMVPDVRARFEEIVRKIGGLSVLMTDEYPGHEDANIVSDDILTLEEARSRLDYEFSLPTWLPEGLTLQEDQIRASNIHTSLTLNWSDESTKGRIVSLRVAQAMPDVNYVVGPNSVTEVMIHDIPATLIRGGWFENTQRWEEEGPRTLRWQVEGVEYTLTTMMPEWRGLSEEELIQIAESFPQP